MNAPHSYMNGTKDEIIRVADQLIRTRGFNAFSYGDIAERMDLRRAAIHYYFPSKEDLGIGVVDRELETMARHRVEWAELAPDQQLKQVMETFYGSSRNGKICLNGSMTPDFSTFPPSLQEKVTEMTQQVTDWVADCLERGREKGLFRFEGVSSDRALLVLSALLSALLLSRVMGFHVFDRMVDRVLEDLGAGFRVRSMRGR